MGDENETGSMRDSLVMFYYERELSYGSEINRGFGSRKVVHV